MEKITTYSKCGGIRLFVIRHGFSCSNYFKRKYKYKNSAKDLIYGAYATIRDPEVSNRGLQDLKDARLRLNIPKGVFEGPNLVLSSTLLRAMETAKVLFPEYKIHSVPYIGETGGIIATPDNTPSKPSDQIKIMEDLSKEVSPNKTERPVIYSYLGDTGSMPVKELDHRFSKKGVEMTKPDFDKFLNWLEKWLPYTKEWNERYENKVFNIVVVAHSNFMRKFMIKKEMLSSSNTDKDDKPQNAAVVEINLCAARIGNETKLYPFVKGCPKIDTFKKKKVNYDSDDEYEPYKQVGLDPRDIVPELPKKEPTTEKDFLCYGIKFYGIPEPDIHTSKGYENCSIYGRN